MSVSAVTDEYVREISKLSKPKLVGLLDYELWHHGKVTEWLGAGPETWSRDELVSAICRVRRGEEP